MKIVMTIAGFDPSSGAGITADLMVFAAHGLFGTSCITSLTVQSTVGVFQTHPVDAAILAETLTCLEDDLPPAGVKIGMLGTSEAVETVAGFLHGLRARPSGNQTFVVIDPVLRSSSGRNLLEPSAAEAMKRQLMPLADWVTPNMDEMEWLTRTTVNDRTSIQEAAVKLQDEVKDHGGRISVLAKGGDLARPDDFILLADGQKTWMAGHRIDTTSTHGTGCALSSALLCRLVQGELPVEAARGAKEYVAEAMRRAEKIGRGKGPMNLLWPLHR